MDREGRRRLLPLRRRLEVPKHRGDRGEDVRLSGVGLADQDVEGPGSQRRLPKGAKPEDVQARDPWACGRRTGVTLNRRHEWTRSEERRVRKKWFSEVTYRWYADNYKKKQKKTNYIRKDY